MATERFILVSMLLVLCGWVIAACTGGGVEIIKQAPTDAGADACNDANMCPCTPGAVQCDDADPSVEQVCVEGEAGPGFETRMCDPGALCAPSVGCQSCETPCKEGEIKCSTDQKSVLQCIKTPINCLEFSVVVDCVAEKMAACSLPDPSMMPGEIKNYCINECGGRGIPLEHAQCDKVDTLPCAVWVCDPVTKDLKPDHQGCLGGGLACNSNDECASCNCSNQVCIGNISQKCTQACF